MKQAQIREKIVAVIAKKLRVSAEDIEQAETLADLGADSLDMTGVIIDLEDTFDIRIPDYDVESLTTLDKVTDYIQNKV